MIDFNSKEWGEGYEDAIHQTRDISTVEMDAQEEYRDGWFTGDAERPGWLNGDIDHDSVCRRKDNFEFDFASAFGDDPEHTNTLAEVPVTTSIYDDPRVVELLNQIAKLTAIVDGFESVVKEHNAAYGAAKAEKEEYLRSVNEQLAVFDSKMRAADHQRREVQLKLDEARMMKQKLHDGVTSITDQLAADAALKEVEDRWAKLEAEWNFVWAQSIRNYQVPAVRFAVEAFRNGQSGVLIADQMGLGKTLEACAIIDVLQAEPNYVDFVQSTCPTINVTKPEAECVLWLCPTAIKEATKRELQKWGREKTVKLQGNAEMRHHIVKLAKENGLILVVGYEQLRDRKGKSVTPELFEHQWPIVVTDEAHKYKAEGKSTFNNVEKICKNAGFVIPMTGTPIMNRPEELWTSLHMCTLKGKYQDKFKDSWRFQAEYCSTWGGKSEFQYGAYDRLIKNISDMVIRRRKDEVLSELPDKIREIRYVDMSEHPLQRDAYNLMRDSFIMWLDDQHEEYVSASAVIAQITRLRQLALYPAGVKFTNPKTGEVVTSEVTESCKLDEALDLIGDLLDADEKVLVFSNYNEPLHELQRRIDANGLQYKGQPAKTGLIIGGQNDATRANKVDQFNQVDGGLAVVLGNIKAMGIGLNLQGACSHAIFLDLDWTPASNEQAEDRLHRMGQKNSVTIHIIQCEDSVDGFIAGKLEDKANMIEGIMERPELRKADLLKALKDGLI